MKHTYLFLFLPTSRFKKERFFSYPFLLLLLFVMGFLCSYPASVSAQKTATTIRLQTGDIVVRENMTAESITNEFKKGRVGAYSYCVFAFTAPVTASQQQALKNMGVELLQYLPDYSYQVRLKTTASYAQLYRAGVRAVTQLPGNLKLDVALQQRIKSQLPFEQVRISIQLHNHVNWQEVSAVLASLDAVFTNTTRLNQGLIEVNIPVKQVSDVSNLPFVSFLSLNNKSLELLNGRERGMFGLTNLTGNEAFGRNLSGKDVTVGVGDDANPSHIDNERTLINRNPAFITNNHGRIVTGTIIGNGIVNERVRGAALNARAVSDYFDLILTKSATYFTDYNMTVTNNSYYNGLARCIGDGEYNELSTYVDQQMLLNPFLQHIFAAGNDGALTCSPYPLSFATIKSGYQVGKNSLDVGNYSIDTDNLDPSSSRGPVKDGRLKPEVIASGTNVVSTGPNNAYSAGYGTSHSAPFVTAVWALLTERYKQLHPGSLPKTALLKNIICNTSDDRGNPGPDYSWGFGLINPRKAAEALEHNRYYSGSLVTGGSHSTVINVPAGTKRAKILLYWHDKEASPLAASALVNDLDLAVENNSNNYLPWILNPAPAAVNANAIRGVDRLNNIEQVTIDDPAATITININGHNIPYGPQEYFVSYEFIKEEIILEHPVGSERLNPGSAEVIRWNANDNSSNPFTIELSTDDGATWSIINNNVPATTNRFIWPTSNIATGKGKIRVSRNGTGSSATSPGNFTILAQPALTAAVPCEGYVNLTWPAVSGATDYEILQLVNNEFASLGTTAASSFRVSGLDKTKTYWFSVRGRITDSPGMRAVARSIVPTIGTACTASEFDQDLKIDSLLSPVHGRAFTNTALTTAHVVTVRIKNLDDVASSGSYTLTYQINGGTVVTELSSISIPPAGTVNYSFATTANFAAPGTYNIKVTVKQPGDTQTANDEQTYTIRHIGNNAVTLPLVENFELADTADYRNSFFALGNLPAFDFNTGSNGRLRTFVNSGVAINGSKAITLDAVNYNGTLANNQVIHTINLSSYSAAQGLRFDFSFKNHGQLKQPGTAVWMRGSDADAWVNVYNLSANQGRPGDVKRASININEIGQSVSSSFQIRFDQQSTTSANNAGYDTEANDLDDGFTFDDFRIVAANNDILLTQLVAPDTFLCNTSAISITVKVKNTTSTVFTNVPVFYRINNGPSVAGSIASLPANSELDYTFTTTANLTAGRAYKIDAWTRLAVDDYAVNDSITNRFVYSSEQISSFPYLERFDSSNGNWFTDTLSYSSWRWGKPAKTAINRSASGNKGWFNTLNSGYRQNENAYLYSPCFNLSSLTQPVFSFSHISQQEDNCNCDFHTLEYSTDNGNTWQRLTAVNGTNWFDSASNQSWKKSIKRWHVSSTEVPAAANIRFRFVFSSDELTQYEGAGIDDIHIFEKATVYTGADVLNNSQSVSGNSWVHFNSGSARIASIHPMGQNLGTTDVSVYINSNPVRYLNNQYYLDRNLVIRSAIAPADSVLIRFYFTEAEVNALLNAAGCADCIKLSDAFIAAVTKYSGSASFENGLLNDGTGGSYLFIDSGKVDVVPFNNGYYAEFKVTSFSEFWINAVDMGLSQLPTDITDPQPQHTFIKQVFTDEAGNLQILAGNRPQVRSITVRIVNSLGQETKQTQAAYTDTKVNISQLPKGIYFIEIRDSKGKEKYIKKISVR